MSAPARVHGWLVFPMREAAGGRDSIDHTIRHFLHPAEAWERLPPRNAVPPAEIRDQIAARGWSLDRVFRCGPGICREIENRRWWLSPRREVIARAHAEGYQPRYMELLRRVDPIGLRGWIPQRWKQNVRYRCDYLGYRLVVEPDGTRKKQASVVTAYRADVLSAGDPPAPVNRHTPAVARHALRVSLADKLRQFCQNRSAPVSPGVEEDD